jgi:hypothetical protein
MVVYKGHDATARNAAGWFGGSTFIRDLINKHEVQLSKWLDHVTTVIKCVFLLICLHLHC